MKVYNQLEKTNSDICYFGYIAVKNKCKKEIKIDLENSLYKEEELVEKIINPTLFGCYKGYKALPCSVFAKVYRREIIEENKIVFDESIKKAEDLLFNANYLTNINTATIISEPLYYYRIHNESTVNTYYVETDLGINKTIYIFKQLEKNIVKIKIHRKINEQLMNSKYVKFFIEYSANICDLRNKDNIKTKYNKIKKLFEFDIIQEKVDNATYYNLNIYEKINLMFIKSRLIFMLVIISSSKNILKKILGKV